MTCSHTGQCFSSQNVLVESERTGGGGDVEKQAGTGPPWGKPSTQKPPCSRRTFGCGVAALLFLLYGALLVALMVKNYSPVSSSSSSSSSSSPSPSSSSPSSSPSPSPSPSSSSLSSSTGEDCNNLLKPISSEEILDTIFAGRWFLQEAYSSDPIDQYALTIAKSSWAEFTRESNGTISLHMAHMLIRNRTIWCVYHHFPNITLSCNKLFLNLPQFNSSANIQFLKSCNECLVLTAEAFVPGYPPLDYLLAYGIRPELNEYFIRPTRTQASCKKLMPPPPFKYHGGEFCPNDDGNGQKAETPDDVDIKRILFPRFPRS